MVVSPSPHRQAGLDLADGGHQDEPGHRQVGDVVPHRRDGFGAKQRGDRHAIGNGAPALPAVGLLVDGHPRQPLGPTSTTALSVPQEYPASPRQVIKADPGAAPTAWSSCKHLLLAPFRPPRNAGLAASTHRPPMLAITDEASPSALRSARNHRFRRAMRRGAPYAERCRAVVQWRRRSGRGADAVTVLGGRALPSAVTQARSGRPADGRRSRGCPDAG
jgi:hypothetical protein